jgi:hypothetical protein
MAVNPLIIASLISGGASLGGALLGKNGGGSVSQVPLEPFEITEARRKLLDFAKTGIFGDFKAGQELPLGYGDFNATEQEKTGLSSLQNLLTSGIPNQYRMGDDALAGLLNPDPNAIAMQFDPFKTQVRRNIGESNAALKRSAAFGKNLYSTNTIQNLGNIEARGNESLTAQLANLTNEALNRRERAIPLAYQSGGAQEALTQNRIELSQRYGGLARQLNDASIKSRDSEILRRRQELQLPIQATQTVTGSSPNYGVPTVSQPSPFQGILDLIANMSGKYLGNELALRQYEKYFPKQAVK